MSRVTLPPPSSRPRGRPPKHPEVIITDPVGFLQKNHLWWASNWQWFMPHGLVAIVDPSSPCGWLLRDLRETPEKAVFDREEFLAGARGYKRYQKLVGESDIFQRRAEALGDLLQHLGTTKSRVR
jgi:hypothetical protein